MATDAGSPQPKHLELNDMVATKGGWMGQLGRALSSFMTPRVRALPPARMPRLACGLCACLLEAQLRRSDTEAHSQADLPPRLRRLMPAALDRSRRARRSRKRR